MRKSFQAVGVVAFAAVSFTVAYAADTFEADSFNVQPESRAYLNFDFGGSREKTHEIHYGLQFGQRGSLSRDNEILRPDTAIKLDYSNVGNNLLVNGRPLVERQKRLNQTEGAAEAGAAAAEEPGFFGKVGNFFSNLWPFGGSEEAAPATETAETTEPGFFSNYTIADYALLGVGVVGVGYAISQVVKGDDSPDPAPPSSTGGGTTGGPLGGLPGGDTLCDPLLNLGCLFVGRDSAVRMGANSSAEYLEWLDGGSGQMGDLNSK